ncbi:unnamed protein product [Phaedon cochleariae]|uniref:Ionotropic glutamate receptor C-terminal domain-containing protein n=1 Tax=Phaedon cochleariae TaxID=80249 RepID=A0A9P0GV97_PHACE|nr:unnamed protein product [Phaedon cochleariae]
MGLIEIVLATMCLNATCDIEPDIEQVIATARISRLAQLAEELKVETLTITTLKNGELSGYKKENATLIGTGLAFEIVHIFQQKFGFTYEIVLPEDNVFLEGTINKGAKNLLEDKKVDVAVAFLPIVNSFRHDVTYSRSFDVAEWSVLMNRPRDSATGSGLLAPFTTEVWIIIIFSVLVIGPIMHLIILARARLCKSDEESVVYPLPDCMWFLYGALLKQGSVLNPVTDSSRILFSTWWLFILIITAFYTANLTAFLTLSKFTLPIKSPSDISAKGYKWVSNKGNGIRDFMYSENHDTMSIENKLVDQIGRGRLYTDLEDMAILDEYVASGQMMFIREKSVIRHVMYGDYKEKTRKGTKESDRCTYVVAKFPIVELPRAFAYKHDFKYKELFDNSIQHLVESGIIQFKLRENLPDAEICPLDLGSTERKLRNSDLSLTYFIVAGGLAFAICVFFIEILWRSASQRYKKARRAKKQNVAVQSWMEKNDNLMKKTQSSEFPTVTPPPSYQALFRPPFFFSDSDSQKKNINGRDYWVIHKNNGFRELIPLRTPSALLFQYSH